MKQNEFNEEQEDSEIINYCHYCKDPVRFNEPHKIKRGKVYHEFCFEQERTVPNR